MRWETIVIKLQFVGQTNPSPTSPTPKFKKKSSKPITDYVYLLQREIASMGGKASSGSFEPGSEKAKEAGRKGGLAS